MLLLFIRRDSAYITYVTLNKGELLLLLLLLLFKKINCLPHVYSILSIKDTYVHMLCDPKTFDPELILHPFTHFFSANDKPDSAMS